MHSAHSEVYPHGGGVLLQKWFDIEKEENRICLTDMAGNKDYYGSSPFLPRDKTIVKYKLLEMVEEMGLCIDEVTDIFQECISLSTMVSDNELGISGWKRGFLDKDFPKKKVQEMLDYGKYLHMQLFMVLQHLDYMPEHPFAPSTTPWRHQQFLKHAKLWCLNDANEFAKKLQVDYLVPWTGCPIVVNECCYKWP